MKFDLIYDSRTGNTEKIAKHIYETYESEIDYFGKIPENTTHQNLAIVCFFTDKGEASLNIQRYLESVNSITIILVGTCGFEKNAQYYESILERTRNKIPDSCHYVNGFMCQGQIAKKFKTTYLEHLAKNHEPKKYEKLLEIYEDSVGHPTKQDMQELDIFLKEALTSFS